MASTRLPLGVLLDGAAPPSVRVAPRSRANSWEDVADLVAILGMPLDEWQEVVLEHAMGERTDGRWASKFVGVSAPRQNGKSQLIVARALAGVLLFGEKTIIISAHETDSARLVWKRLVDVVEDNPTLEKRVTGRMDAINREFLSFGRGAEKQTIKLKARRAAGARGFSADCLLLDEGQILGKQAWGSIVPTMSAMPNPQLWLFGTPPTMEDDAFAFTRVRDSALHKKARHTWLEWAADPKDDIDDPATWAKANPSYGVRISHEACVDDRAAMDDEQFALERLGIWADPTKTGGDAFDQGAWEACQASDLEPVVDALGVAVAFDRLHASIGAAGLVGDQLVVGAVDRREGTAWVIPELRRLQEKYGCPVVVDPGGPSAELVAGLELAGVNIDEDFKNATTLGLACQIVYDRVRAGTLSHPGHPDLDAAVSVATRRDVGEGPSAWAWARRRSGGDISMLEAVTLAGWAASAGGSDPSAYVL